MSRKLVFFLSFLVALFLVYPQDAHAKRTLPGASGAKTTTAKKAVGGVRGVDVSVKFRADRKAIVATFSNLEIASSVSYSLSYTASRGVKEGAGGTISDLSAGTVSRELLFATCSAGVCRYHTGIKNAKFTVTTKLKNG
ncbi:MAG: hypothetical protein HYS83_01415, partial [Candidatus Blackburnbacteria bacterium]|nr:hypothetical protein [Candidatus Blackburnbacteria bacterium]